ncbi:MAG: carboxylesterase/lipase family protein [Bacteroidales bacterium]|nr:carboxylesterase/lipase family protein [Bacteroidales bacterium]
MNLNRRSFFKTCSVGATGLGLSSPFFMGMKSESELNSKTSAQQLFIGDNIAVTDTPNGKVRGYILRNIYYFLGIPYGADTSGINRFMPPQKPQPWTGIYPALWWGNTAPQPMEKRYANKYNSFRDHWNYDDVSEDCLRINIFTPGYNDGIKRPVLLWIHGGNWTRGNGIEHDGYNGENLARQGDIVFCSINHRLGPLGFSDFSEVGGEKYNASGNVGVMDLVAALEWIHDNIVNFGGDPGNVTIMGQSGGGAKVCTLTALPSAKGLFSKAVVLSGARLVLKEQEMTKRAGAYLLKEAGLNASQINKLQEMSWQNYYALALNAEQKLLKDLGMSPSQTREIYWPHVDGGFIPHHPYHPEASPNAAEIPMIISSATEEQSPSWLDPSLESISFQGVKEELRKNYYGDTDGARPEEGLSTEKASEIVDAYAKAFPHKRPVEIWSMLSTRYRQRSVMLADVKSKQLPPVYLAWFGWQPPMFDYRMRAFHCLDICFWFSNTDLMLTHTGGGERPRSLSRKMSGSLLQFMRTGDPNGGGLPEWPRYTSGTGETMFLNEVCEVQNDPDKEARAILPPYEGY